MPFFKNKSQQPNPKPQIQTVGQLHFGSFSIPDYQRPYKWTSKNVKQLITDIRDFRDKKHYRLGTLVLYNNKEEQTYEIVDGQQRIVTLSLLIKKMYEWIKKDKRYCKEDKNFVNKEVDKFIDKTKYSNKYSLHNVVENIHVIETYKDELNYEIWDFLLHKCEFVVIELNDLSEAFQFFDSQNARGKDLAPHDLLKAYHMREIDEKNLSEKDKENIRLWHKPKRGELEEIFLILFRAKHWSMGLSARDFTKDDIAIFKGLSLKEVGKCYPFYKMELIAHEFSKIYDNDKEREMLLGALSNISNNNKDIVKLFSNEEFEYPFNLDDQIVNGTRFFDMVRHYTHLYNHVKNADTYKDCNNAKEIMDVLDKYEGKARIGDKNVRRMFDTLLIYYIDRFGDEELDKVVPKFFIWAYKLRLTLQAVQLSSVDNWAKDEKSMFRKVHEVNSPYDIINLTQESISEKEVEKSTKCEEIKKLFIKFKKIYK